jgi:hypothetical protein
LFKNLGEGNKPLLQSRAHDDDNNPLLPLLVCRGWIARNSPLSVILPLHLSPFFFVALVLLFHNSTHTQLKTYIHTYKKKRKEPKEEQKDHKNLN